MLASFKFPTRVGLAKRGRKGEGRNGGKDHFRCLFQISRKIENKIPSENKTLVANHTNEPDFLSESHHRNRVKLVPNFKSEQASKPPESVFVFEFSDKNTTCFLLTCFKFKRSRTTNPTEINPGPGNQIDCTATPPPLDLQRPAWRDAT